MSRKNKKEKSSKKKSAEVFEELDNEVTEEYEETSETASDYADDNGEALETGSYDNSEAYTSDNDDSSLGDDTDMTDNSDTDDDTSKVHDDSVQEESDNNISEEALEEPEEEEVKEKDLFKKHIEREAILDQIFDDNGYKKNDVIKEEKEKVPYKGAGIFMLILVILGIAFIGTMVYFIILNPYYIKSGEADKNLEYPELSSPSDSDELSELLKPYGATATDAEEEVEE
ncbi:MAG: DUF3784 domain-containing protein [Lachnospiraceae bacterium]|nr:DUF3784 domain-containing protein [Lachnospiraceae bacterium]